MKKENKEYQRPSITVIEADLQQPIATSASASDSMKINSWVEDDTGGYGTIEDIE